MALLGEADPELFVPGTAGAVVNNEQLVQMLGGQGGPQQTFYVAGSRMIRGGCSPQHSWRGQDGGVSSNWCGGAFLVVGWR